MARTMRKFDLDGVIDPGAADLGETIIKAGLATFPNNPQLLILYANFMMEVRRDSPASRTQLQVRGLQEMLSKTRTESLMHFPSCIGSDRLQAQPQFCPALSALLHRRKHKKTQGELRSGDGLALLC